jgi:hypothetical protein
MRLKSLLKTKGQAYEPLASLLISEPATNLKQSAPLRFVIPTEA